MAMVNPYNYAKPSKVSFNEPFKKSVVSKQNVGINQKIMGNNKSSQNASSNKQDAYLVQKVMNAKPEELTMMLYEGMIKFIKLAKYNLEKGNMQEVNENAIKAQNIVTELMSTLNMDYEISKQLDELYAYLFTELLDGNIKKDGVHFDNALEIAEELAYTWKEVMKLA